MSAVTAAPPSHHGIRTVSRTQTPSWCLLLFLLYHVSAVVFASDYLEFDSWQVLGPTTLHQYHIVFLQVVSLPRNEHYSFFTVRQPHSCALPVCRVGLLGLSDHGLQDNRLELRAAERGAYRCGGCFGLPETVHLVEGGHRPGQERGHPGRGTMGGCRHDKGLIHLK